MESSGDRPRSGGIRASLAAMRSSLRRLAAVAAVIGSTAALLTVVAAAPASATPGCWNSGNLQQLGPSTPVVAHNHVSSTTLGYLYIGWDKTSLCSYAEIDWLNDSSGVSWSRNASGDIYLNWNDPAHNSAQGKLHFNPGQAVSWVSTFVYQGPGTTYTPGRSFTAAVANMSVTVAVPPYGATSCNFGIDVGSTHDFSNGWNSGPGSVTCGY